MFCERGVVLADFSKCLSHRDPANTLNRRVRTNVRGHYCITAICQEDNAGTTPARQQHSERGNCSNTCVDAKVPYAGRVGEEEATIN